MERVFDEPGISQGGLAKPVGVKRVGKEHANADEHQECRYDFCHSLPPCIVMPIKARLRNSR